MTMSLIAGVAAFVLTVLAMPHFITYYKIKKIGGQQMHEDVKQHLAKAGTPTMGGTVFLVVAILVSLIFNFHVFSEGHQAYGATVGILFVILIYGIIGFYILMNIAYCIKLKQKAIVDVFIIAVGFVFRLLVGGFATGIWVSHWIILMTFLLALFLAFAKRRDDIVMFEETGVKARQNVDRYNVVFMNQAIGIVASITIVCYIMYTVSVEVIERFNSQYLYITSIFVLAGIIRYLQVTIVDVKSGSPTKVLLKDRFIQLCIVGWVITFSIILYL